MDRLIRDSKKLQRKSEQLNADIEKLRSKIKKFQYNQAALKKPRRRA
jgi:cell division protein FtsB